MYTINIPAIRTYLELQNGIEYSKVYVEGFSNLHEVGKPNVPAFQYFMVTPLRGTAKITILDEKSRILEKFTVHPALKPHLDTEFEWDVEPSFEIDNTIYSSNAFFPKSPVRIISNAIFHGVPISTIQVCPVLHNPVTRQLKVYTKLTVQVEFTGGTEQGMGGGKFETIIRSLTTNGGPFFNSIRSENRCDIFDPEFDYLIITHDSFNEVA